MQLKMDALTQRCQLLESTIQTLTTSWVPPSSFLPKYVWDQHRDVIELINEYYLIFRATLREHSLPSVERHSGSMSQRRELSEVFPPNDDDRPSILRGLQLENAMLREKIRAQREA